MNQCPVCGYQLLPSERVCPKCRGRGASPGAPASPPRTSGLAVASLVVGILALCGGLLALPGLILGIVALRQVNRSQGRLSGQGLAIAGVALSGVGIVVTVAILAFVLPTLYPVFLRARGAATTASCLSQAKQVSLGALMYARDHDDKLPPAETWSDSLMPYVRDASTFVCPEAPNLRSGYAYNRDLSNLTLGDIGDPPRTVLIFESSLGWNGAGGAEALLSPPRHDGRNVVSFADGSVRLVRALEQAQLLWQPTAGSPPAP
ncbi:MAG TPA: DUF4190 domain-containing protein [Armatimonadota bacterium]|nr:DUF4190 domain-containing protein [Armatimonadota bacterium]